MDSTSPFQPWATDDSAKNVKTERELVDDAKLHRENVNHPKHRQTASYNKESVAVPSSASGSSSAAAPGGEPARGTESKMDSSKIASMQQIVENTLSQEGRQRVAQLLEAVEALSGAERLLLYLRLPTGVPQHDPLKQPINPLGSRAELQQTVTWIQTHLEVDPDVSLPKQDVYDEYIAHCMSSNMKPLSTADFGKVMKQVYPTVRPRRLGTRGNSRYKHIIENKCTNAVSTLKKNEAWEFIALEFNSSSEIPRTQKQLNTAYLNLKRSTRQSVANENVKKYLQQKHNNIIVDNEEGPSEIITLVDETKNDTAEINNILKQFKKDEIADKKGVRATGGGIYNPVLSSIGAQMLALMGDQVKPLSNQCDSASTYYKNDEDVTICDVMPLQVVLQPDLPDHNYTPLVTKTNSIPQKPNNKVRNRRNMQQNNRKSTKSNQHIKKQYYQKKMECAIIEKKTKLLEYRMAIKKEKVLDLEIKVKQKEYENLLNK